MVFRGYEIAGRTIALIVGILILVALALYIPSCIQKQRSQKAQAKVDAAQSQAASQSAQEAGETQATVNRNEVASEALGRQNEKDIRNAEGSNAVVAAPARDAGLRALCMRRAYRDNQRCKLFYARRGMDETR